MQVIGLDVTHKCSMTAEDLDSLQGQGRHGSFIHQISQFYLQYHHNAYGMPKIYLHDPTALVGVLHPEYFTWQRGAIRVVTDGVAKGHTIMDAGLKDWVGSNDWLARPKVSVALGVRGDDVRQLIMQLLSS